MSTLAGKYADAKYWNDLAACYLSHYNLPGWDVRYAVEAAAVWLDRLDIPKAAWLATGNYSGLAEFSVLNPSWQLRAFIGLALELKHEIVQLGDSCDS